MDAMAISSKSIKSPDSFALTKRISTYIETKRILYFLSSFFLLLFQFVLILPFFLINFLLLYFRNFRCVSRLNMPVIKLSKWLRKWKHLWQVLACWTTDNCSVSRKPKCTNWRIDNSNLICIRDINALSDFGCVLMYTGRVTCKTWTGMDGPHYILDVCACVRV